jgi:hypothetical protein
MPALHRSASQSFGRVSGLHYYHCAPRQEYSSCRLHLQTSRRCIGYSCLPLKKKLCLLLGAAAHAFSSAFPPTSNAVDCYSDAPRLAPGLHAHQHHVQPAGRACGSGLCRVAVRGGRRAPGVQVLARAHRLEQATEEGVALAHQLQRLRS